MNRRLSLVSAAIVSVGLTLSAPVNAVIMNYIGQWTSTMSYAAGSVVFSGNQTFYALNASTGQNPLAAASYWKLIGTNGNTVRSGTAAPTSAIGNAGDFYIETTNKRLYGPRTAAGWPATYTALIGPTGPQGPIGATGPKGSTGAAGPAGPQGATGPSGPQGPMGVAGPAGPQGAVGPTGAAGAAGKTVLSGTVAPTSIIGNVGDFYIETTNKRLYGPKPATGWPATYTALIGQTGPQGPIGLTGPAGAKGATGGTGPQGPQGATGPAGPQGSMGVAGPAGPQGATGATGPQGPQGPMGTMPPGMAKGDIQYWDGSAWKILQIGVQSQVLMSCGGLPTWTNGQCPFYNIGDAGPAGGIVFYVDLTGAHGLEAAVENLPDQIWGCSGQLLGSSGSSIGTGSRNTRTITSNCSDSSFAAKATEEYAYSGFTDWYLPSQDEMVALANAKNIVPGLNSNLYWTSTEMSTTEAICVFVGDKDNGFFGTFCGNWSLHGKPNDMAVRPIRSF